MKAKQFVLVARDKRGLYKPSSTQGHVRSAVRRDVLEERGGGGWPEPPPLLLWSPKGPRRRRAENSIAFSKAPRRGERDDHF